MITNMKYYARLNNNNTIIGVSNFSSPNSIEINREIFENYQDYIFDGDSFIINPNLESIKELHKREEMGMLYMTPLDFIKALETIGITWAQIKELMQKYPDVEKELTMCQNVYRGNPLLDQMAKVLDKNITSEVLDNLFIQVCNTKEE